MVMKRRNFIALTCMVLGYAAFAYGQATPQATDEIEQPKAATAEATIPAAVSSRAAETLLRKARSIQSWPSH